MLLTAKASLILICFAVVLSACQPVYSTPDRPTASEAVSESEEFQRLPWELQERFAAVAVASPNTEKPPFYLDMPYEMVGDEAQIVREVFDRIVATDMIHDVDRYLSQPMRLANVLLDHGKSDDLSPVELVKDYDKLLSDVGGRR